MPVADGLPDEPPDRVALEGMTFFGRHGVLPAERALGQRFVVDVELAVDLAPAGRSDDLADAVDYAAVHRAVRAVVEGEPADLIETVAERVAAVVLAGHDRVAAVRVRVAKPQVRLEDTVLTGAAVQVLRRRQPAASRPPASPDPPDLSAPPAPPAPPDPPRRGG